MVIQMVLYADIDKNLEKRFRKKVIDIHGASKGALKKALEQAIEKWLEENGNK